MIIEWVCYVQIIEKLSSPGDIVNLKSIAKL